MQTGLLNLPERKMKAIDEFVKALNELSGERVKKIILFGSVARGDFDEESDIDLLVVGDVRVEDVSRITSRILVEYGEVISAIVRTEDEMKGRKSFSFYKTVLKEGVEIA